MSGQTSIAGESLLALPIDEALVESEEWICRAYSRVFLERSKRCDVGGDRGESEAWWLLWRLAELRLDASDTSQPFRPVWVGGGSRSMIPVDLRGEAAGTVRELGLSLKDPELRARLLDVVWEANRDHTVVGSAVAAYLESAKRLLDPDNWVPCAERFERALRLAVLLNQRGFRDEALSEIEKTVLWLNAEDGLFLTCRLVSLLLEFDAGDLRTLAALSDKGASNAEGARAFRQAEEHLGNLAKCRRKLGDVDAERSAMGRIASFLELDGLSDLENGEYMRAAHWLEQAYVRYRQIPGMRGKASEVYDLFRAAQRGAAESMETVALPDIDVTDEVERAREFVSGYGFGEAFWRLLSMIRPVDFADAERAARESLEGGVWRRLVSATTVAADGRIVAKDSPIGGIGIEELEAVPWEDIVRYVTLHQQFQGDLFVRPAMQQIMLEHVPVWRDIFGVVAGSPLVPFGHEGLFVEGVLSGLRGDLVHALSVLVPQFENSLRELLRASGVEPSSMDKDCRQDVFQMGRILSQETLSEVLGPDLVKEMRVLFTDDHGTKLRDHMSHGLTSSADFYRGAAWYAWWLICRVCFHPSVLRHLEPPDEISD